MAIKPKIKKTVGFTIRDIPKSDMEIISKIANKQKRSINSQLLIIIEEYATENI